MGNEFRAAFLGGLAGHVVKMINQRQKCLECSMWYKTECSSCKPGSEDQFHILIWVGFHHIHRSSVIWRLQSWWAHYLAVDREDGENLFWCRALPHAGLHKMRGETSRFTGKEALSALLQRIKSIAVKLSRHNTKMMPVTTPVGGWGGFSDYELSDCVT